MKKTKFLKNIITTVLLPLCFIGNVHATTISSTFDSDDEGWLVTGDSTSSAPTYVALGGNPGGFIQAKDRVVGGVWYFDAPNMFLGDMSGAYNQALKFDLQQTGSANDPQFSAADIILNGGGLELKYDNDPNPLPLGSWVSYSVILSEAGWLNGGVAATQADIQTVLGSLNKLQIRGEFITGPDTGKLDNVSINVVPIPLSAWLFASGLLGLVGIRRKSLNQ